ncbi:MAG: hypothetical protein BroJett033_6540 [Chloroflexota bacterium]|nr:MAG: hypothetical protein BroJett033_6540 [Chloroflexota bacterium]
MTKPAKPFVINPETPFFIFDTNGEWHATLINGCLWDANGEYMGFVRGENHDVYTLHGEWVGNLAHDGRIIRRRMSERQPLLKIRRLPPQKPVNLPARAPLPPQHAELAHTMIDVLDWDPDVFKNVPDLKSDLT